jgi:hypothetical protein
MSLLRIGIFVALVIAVLPEDKEQQSRLYERAANAVHWTATFCDRNGRTCTQAANVWQAFVRKARFGAEMAYDLAVKYARSGNDSAPADALLPTKGTLTPEDLEPAWRGDASGNDV